MKNLDISKLIFKVVPDFMSNVRTCIKKASEPDLGFVRFRILANIQRGLNSASHIADLHGVSQAAISKHVDALFDEGLLVRKESKEDRRCVKLDLSAKGRKKVKDIKFDGSKSFEDSLNLLNNEEKLELVSALKCLESFLIKIQENKS